MQSKFDWVMQPSSGTKDVRGSKQGAQRDCLFSYEDYFNKACEEVRLTCSRTRHVHVLVHLHGAGPTGLVGLAWSAPPARLRVPASFTVGDLMAVAAVRAAGSFVPQSVYRKATAKELLDTGLSSQAADNDQAPTFIRLRDSDQLHELVSDTSTTLLDVTSGGGAADTKPRTRSRSRNKDKDRDRDVPSQESGDDPAALEGDGQGRMCGSDSSPMELWLAVQPHGSGSLRSACGYVLKSANASMRPTGIRSRNGVRNSSVGPAGPSAAAAAFPAPSPVGLQVSPHTAGLSISDVIVAPPPPSLTATPSGRDAANFQVGPTAVQTGTQLIPGTHGDAQQATPRGPALAPGELDLASIAAALASAMIKTPQGGNAAGNVAGVNVSSSTATAPNVTTIPIPADAQGPITITITSPHKTRPHVLALPAHGAGSIQLSGNTTPGVAGGAHTNIITITQSGAQPTAPASAVGTTQLSAGAGGASLTGPSLSGMIDLSMLTPQAPAPPSTAAAAGHTDSGAAVLLPLPRIGKRAEPATAATVPAAGGGGAVIGVPVPGMTPLAKGTVQLRSKSTGAAPGMPAVLQQQQQVPGGPHDDVLIPTAAASAADSCAPLPEDLTAALVQAIAKAKDASTTAMNGSHSNGPVYGAQGLLPRLQPSRSNFITGTPGGGTGAMPSSVGQDHTDLAAFFPGVGTSNAAGLNTTTADAAASLFQRLQENRQQQQADLDRSIQLPPQAVQTTHTVLGQKRRRGGAHDGAPAQAQGQPRQGDDDDDDDDGNDNTGSPTTEAAAGSKRRRKGPGPSRAARASVGAMSPLSRHGGQQQGGDELRRSARQQGPRRNFAADDVADDDDGSDDVDAAHQTAGQGGAAAGHGHGHGQVRQGGEDQEDQETREVAQALMSVREGRHPGEGQGQQPGGGGGVSGQQQQQQQQQHQGSGGGKAQGERRQRTKYSEEEIHAILDGLLELTEAQREKAWATIRSARRLILFKRSNVDLKDKWRTLQQQWFRKELPPDIAAKVQRVKAKTDYQGAWPEGKIW